MQQIPDLESGVVLGDVSWQHKGVEWVFAATPAFCSDGNDATASSE